MLLGRLGVFLWVIRPAATMPCTQQVTTHHLAALGRSRVESRDSQYSFGHPSPVRLERIRPVMIHHHAGCWFAGLESALTLSDTRAELCIASFCVFAPLRPDRVARFFVAYVFPP